MLTAVILMVLAAQHASFGRASAAQTSPLPGQGRGAGDTATNRAKAHGNRREVMPVPEEYRGTSGPRGFSAVIRAAEPTVTSGELWSEPSTAGRTLSRQDWRWRWQVWLPDKWQRIGACETGYGKRPGNWKWNSGTYQGAFGFHYTSWDRFRRPQDPHEAYQATPWAQYQVALRIWRRYGFSGWGCRNA